MAGKALEVDNDGYLKNRGAGIKIWPRPWLKIFSLSYMRFKKNTTI